MIKHSCIKWSIVPLLIIFIGVMLGCNSDAIPLDTTNFDNNLGPGDDDLQTAMESIDEFILAGGGSGLTQENVQDMIGNLINDGDSIQTRITVTYDDTDNAVDFIVDNMNDDVPDAGDFGAAVDLDANGNILSDAVHDSMIDWGTAANQVSGTDMPLNTANFDGNLSGADNTVLKAFETLDEIAAGGAGDDMGSVDTEAELESALTDVSDVITSNDSDAVDDSMIDFGTGANQVSGSDMPNEDLGDISVSGGAWSVDDNVIDDTMINWGTGANQVSGLDVPLNVTAFNNNLSASDTDIQKAMETLDEIAAGSLGTAHIFLTAGGGIPRTTNGCSAVAQTETSSNKVNYYTLDFDKDADEYAQWSFAMPSDWDAGTITVKVYWTFTTGAGSETVEFDIGGVSIGNDDPLDAARGSVQSCTDTAITAGDVHITAASSAITIAGAAAGDFLIIECMRDVSEDNLAGDAQLIGIMITYGRS